MGRPITKTIEEHKRTGTYRRDRHAAREAAEGKFSPPKKPPGRVQASARSQSKWIRGPADEMAVSAGCRFNEVLAEHVVSFFRNYLRHSKGVWAGDLFEPAQWQIDDVLFPLFGWVRPDGSRRFRRTYVELPKKQGKSTLAAGIGLYMLLADGEAGAEVYSLGADKDQARIVHNEAISMVKASPEIAVNVGINKTTGTLSVESTQSVYRVLSAAPRGKHGLNIHCSIADELHEWQGDVLWNALKYGYRARSQPLALVITNAGDDLHGICYQQRLKAERIIRGESQDDQFLAVIYSTTEALADAEIKSVSEGATEIPVAESCNPALGEIVKHEDVLRDIRDAVEVPAEMPNLKRLLYGVWVHSHDPWISDLVWNRGNEVFTEGDLEGAGAYCGIDLSRTRDLSCVCWIVPQAGKYYVVPRVYIPEDLVERKEVTDNAPYKAWIAAGLLRACEGDEIDYGQIRTDFNDDARFFDMVGGGFDPHNASHLCNQLLRIEDGWNLESVPQTDANMVPPTIEAEALCKSGNLIHGGNELLTWCMRGVACPNGRPMKKRSTRRIDPVVAMVIGLGYALAGDKQGQGPSIW